MGIIRNFCPSAAAIGLLVTFLVLTTGVVPAATSAPAITSLTPADGANETRTQFPKSAWHQAPGTQYPNGLVAPKTNLSGQSWTLVGDPAVPNGQTGPPYYAYIAAKNASGYYTFALKSQDKRDWTVANDGDPVRTGISPSDAVYHNGTYHLFGVDVSQAGNPPVHTEFDDPLSLPSANDDVDFITPSGSESDIGETGAVVVGGTWYVGYEWQDSSGNIYSGLANGSSPTALSRPFGAAYKLVPHGPDGSWRSNDTADPDPIVINGRVTVFHDGRNSSKKFYKIGAMTGGGWSSSALSETSAAPVYESTRRDEWDAWGTGDFDTYRLGDGRLAALYEASNEESNWHTQVGLAIGPLNWTNLSATATHTSGNYTATFYTASGEVLGSKTVASGETARIPYPGLAMDSRNGWYVKVCAGGACRTSEVRSFNIGDPPPAPPIAESFQPDEIPTTTISLLTSPGVAWAATDGRINRLQFSLFGGEGIRNDEESAATSAQNAMTAYNEHNSTLTNRLTGTYAETTGPHVIRLTFGESETATRYLVLEPGVLGGGWEQSYMTNSTSWAVDSSATLTGYARYRADDVIQDLANEGGSGPVTPAEAARLGAAYGPDVCGPAVNRSCT